MEEILKYICVMFATYFRSIVVNIYNKFMVAQIQMECESHVTKMCCTNQILTKKPFSSWDLLLLQSHHSMKNYKLYTHQLFFFVIGIKQAGTIGLNILDQISTGFIH